jgi:uncharacterized protein YjbJ (UPF0337 family)
MQTKLQITVNWNELKIKLKEKNPNLTDTDLNFLAGKEDDLVTRLARKLAKTEEEITDVIDELQLKTLKTEKETHLKEPGESHDAERRETENRDAERREKESQKEEF